MAPPDKSIPGPGLALLEKLGGIRAKGHLPGPEDILPGLSPLWPTASARKEAALALTDPFLALTMLWRTLGRGFRGNPHHLRPTDSEGPRLYNDLLAFLRLHLRIRQELPSLVDWPAQGVPADSLKGADGWCDLCGECCCHAGTVPNPPAGVNYPPYFHHALAGAMVYPQPYCPFLFQALDRPLYFCGLHPVKPLACRRFDQKDCQRGLGGRGYRPPVKTASRSQ